MNAERPAWCPDPRCEARGAPFPMMLCGGRTDGGARLCLRFDEPCGVRTLDIIADAELTELQRLLARLYSDAKDAGELAASVGEDDETRPG